MRRTLPLALLGLALFASPPQAEAKPRDDVGTQTKLAKPDEVSKEIDQRMATVWRANEVKVRGKATDAEFLRRISLDLTGVVPNEESVRTFLANGRAGKRAQKAKALLTSKAWARTQALRWTYTLVGREYLMRTKNYAAVRKMMRMRDRRMGAGMDDEMGYDTEAVLSMDEWIAAEMHENTPWDVIATQLIAAEGSVDKNPASHYALRFARDGKAAEMTGNVMRVFQGLQVQCAQCHDHPYDKYSQREFWGLTAFFSRTAARRLPPPPGTPLRKNGQKAKGPFMVFDRPRGQARMPADKGETGALVLPRFLTGQIINPGDGVNRRAEVAKFITAPSNPYFAKATVNRVWSHFFGRGLINPIDEIDQDDLAHPDVMTLLTEDFQRSGYDMRRLAEVIVNTRAYQLSSAGPEDGRDDEIALFARAPLRSLSAEQLFYSVLEATGMEDLRKADNRAVRRRLERMKFGLLRQFVRVFGTDEEEVVDEGTIPQALMLLNGPLTNDAVRPRVGHPVYDRLFAMRDADDQIETIYLRVLGRPATRGERNRVVKYFKATKGQGPTERARAYADVFWALLNSSEFNLIH